LKWHNFSDSALVHIVVQIVLKKSFVQMIMVPLLFDDIAQCYYTVLKQALMH